MAQLVLDGIVSGSVIALAALGVTLVFGVARFVNAAHGDFMTLGAYLALWLNVGAGLHLGFAGMIAAPLAVAAVMTVHHLVFRPLQRKSQAAVLIASIGVALVLRSAVAILWGSAIQAYRYPVSRALAAAGLRITPTDLAIVGVAVLAIVGTWLVLYRTRIGKEMRAVADLPDLARVVGIDSARVTRWTWAIVGVLATIAGVLLGLRTSLSPNLGWNVIIPAFAAAILGGLGNPLGALAGGVTLGIVEEVSTLFVASTYKTVVAFVIMGLVLLWRPTGIFGEGRAR